MIPHSILPMKAALAPAREVSWRRSSHGGSAFSTEPHLMQPQDGASSTDDNRISFMDVRQPIGAEPEDARLTGVTRSLFRRLMGLNVMTAPILPVPASMARSPKRVVPISSTALATKVA